MTIRELREHFRKQFEEHDFCIGEEHVERVFRELLGEPEPIREKHSHIRVNAEEVSDTMREIFKDTNKVFERVDTFFSKISRRSK